MTSDPKKIAEDIIGVQPMTGPTGLIFAMKTRYLAPGVYVDEPYERNIWDTCISEWE